MICLTLTKLSHQLFETLGIMHYCFHSLDPLLLAMESCREADDAGGETCERAAALACQLLGVRMYLGQISTEYDSCGRWCDLLSVEKFAVVLWE